MTTIKNYINENNQSGTLFVLKGFDLTENGFNKVYLEDSFNNKAFNRLAFLTQQEVAVISYEEFICINALIKEVFKKIVILDNPIYLNLYPVNVNLNGEIEESLLKHFDDEVDENTELADITPYLDIYNNFIKTNFGIACSYNIDDSILKTDKVEIIVLGNNDYSKELEEYTDITKNLEYRNIYTELDYFNLVQELINEQNNCYCVNYENYNYGKETIKRALMLLNSNYCNRLFIASSEQQIIDEEDKYEDVDKIMKKYWGYETYKQLKVYDLEELQKGIKKIKTISQKRIINDILEQSENTIKGISHRDIFVTAPTSAGKSLVFLLPAIYMAEKNNLVTIVVSPLISLMKDQIDELKTKGYNAARTINSDVLPLIKQEILDDIANSKAHILYLSPESLLSKSDIEQLIGKRRIGMVVIDEAHIVTTWGKQFRPDYWFLGDHIQKIRTAQDKKYNQSFVLATFTATAIYGGKEDMYGETKSSLHMFNPITYLGYLKRDNIEIDISEVKKESNKKEYESDKFDNLINYVIKPSLVRGQKTLIYFPTVSLINRFYDYCNKNLLQYISIYHGQLPSDMKNKYFEEFKNGNRKVMLATKAFGMGINIPDISVVSHFAPTGNVCDYMQEIGRVARSSNIHGYAIYKHMSKDFKHINRLHGLSAIKPYQLVNVIKKINELYKEYRKNPNLKNTKKSNAMLIDTDCFSYIFNSSLRDENDLINKVKTALLLIQKDYDNKSFSPFHFRPSTLFEYGFLAINPIYQNLLNKKYNNSVEEVYNAAHICKVNLKKIWEKDYQEKFSFPKFKFLLYSGSKELDFNTKYKFSTAVAIDILYENKYYSNYENRINTLKEIVYETISKNKYYSIDMMIKSFIEKARKNKDNIDSYMAESIINTFMTSINAYKNNNYEQKCNSKIYAYKENIKMAPSYLFDTSSENFFKWIDNTFKFIENNLVDHKLYLNLSLSNSKGIFTLLGLLEAIGVLKFKSLGGTNSQIYIYVNETKRMQIVSDKPYAYKNKLLESINNRHSESVKMLSFLYEGKFSSDEIWEHLENYFLGILPKELQDDANNQVIDKDTLVEKPVKFETGCNLKEDYSNWEEASGLYDVAVMKEIVASEIPLADYYNSSLIIDDFRINGCFTWVDQKLMLTTGEENPELREVAEKSGWLCFPIDTVLIDQIKTILE